EAKVAARRRQIFFAGGDFLVVGVPGAFVIARFSKCAANGFFYAHARSGIAALTAGNREIRTLGVFTESEFNAGDGAFKRKLLCGLAPAQFDDDGLATDGVGAAVENVRCGDATSEVAKDRDVVGVENFGDVGDGRNGDAAFVHTAVDSDVRVAVDDAGCDVEASAIDDLRACRGFYVRTDFGDFAVFDENRTVFDGALRDGEDGGVLNQNDRRRVGWSRSGNCEACDGKNACERQRLKND